MATIQLFRIDFRLIHGQVITKWIKQVPANRIVIVDDVLANDEFMADIYRMAAPPDIKVEVYGLQAAVDAWKADQMGSGNIFMLVRDVKTALWLKENGFGVTDIQIGGLGGGSDRVLVSPAITFDEPDVAAMQKLEQLGVNVYIHVLPAEPRIELQKAIEKYNSIKKR